MRNLFEINDWKIIQNRFDPNIQREAESIFLLETEALVSERISKRNILVTLYKAAMSAGYIILIKLELDGGKMAIRSTSPKY